MWVSIPFSNTKYRACIYIYITTLKYKERSGITMSTLTQQYIYSNNSLVNFERYIALGVLHHQCARARDRDAVNSQGKSQFCHRVYKYLCCISRTNPKNSSTTKKCRV